jgi:tRNA U34 2-thiouridine synthase MnmA/TrmU
MPEENPIAVAASGQQPIAVAMSGGVDSSVVAGLLHRQGHRVIGMTMQLWNQKRIPETGGRRDGPLLLAG